jgi:hypothetical protein
MRFKNKILRSGDTSYPAFSASIWHFLTLKASHVRQNEWLSTETLPDSHSFGYSLSIGISIDPIGILFPEMWSLIGIRWCSNGV